MPKKSISNSLSLSVPNYHPISNLPTHSKLPERFVAKQLTAYMISNKISSIFQSAYIPQKSTETALTLISSNSLFKFNNTHGTIITLLEMSSTIISFFIDCPPSELMARPFNGVNLILPTDYHVFVSQNIYHLIIKSPMVSPRPLYWDPSFSTSTSPLSLRFLTNIPILISTLMLMTYKFTLTALTHPHTVLIESQTVFLIYSNGLIIIL